MAQRQKVCVRAGDGNYELRLQSPAMRGCCMCPVLPAADSFALSPNGTAYYRPPHFDPYGGTGILLSRGLLDAIDEHLPLSCSLSLIIVLRFVCIVKRTTGLARATIRAH